MLNGKFYTGLPVNMMERRDGPNRQRTNFYWPDESQMESALDTRTKLRNRGRIEKTPEKTIAHEVNPNELHKKELSSKINLDDNLTASGRKPSSAIKTVIEKPVNIKRRDTFSSKIQFYDFDNEAVPPVRRTDKNSKIEVEKNSKNSIKTSDKRISFTENKLKNETSSNQEILKNNRTSSKPTASEESRKPAIKNLSKSKSMSDVSAQNNIRTIENNVRNLSISQNQNQTYLDEEDDHIPPPRRQVRIAPRPSPSSKRNRPVTEYYDDIEDDYYYSQRRRSPGLTIHPNHRRSHYDDIEPDYDDFYPPLKSNRERINSSQQLYTRRVEHRSNNREPDYDDDYNYRFERCRSETPKRTFARQSNQQPKLNHDDYDALENYTQETQPVSPPPPASVDRNIDEGQKPNNLDQNTRNRTMTPPSQNRAQNRAHRHLVSNVAFWSDAETGNSSARSIRSSAVTRVSVGLPDS